MRFPVLAPLLLSAAACGGPPPSSVPHSWLQPAAAAEVTSVDGGTDGAHVAGAAAEEPGKPKAPTLRPVDEGRWPARRQPLVEIQFPILEQQIPLSKASRYLVRLKVEDWPMRPGGRGIQLVLDGEPAGRIHARRVRLGDLVVEGTSLGAGEHELVAFAVRADGTGVKPARPTTRGPFAAVRFWVGPKRQRPQERGPTIVYNLPRGTLNGEAAADAAKLDFYLLNVEQAAGRWKVAAVLRGPDGLAETRFELSRWQTHAIGGLLSGDYEIQLALEGPDGTPIDSPRARTSRTITVNRDAPVPGKLP